MKIDLCLLSKQWIIHLNASNWSGWVFLMFSSCLPSLSYYCIQYACKIDFCVKIHFTKNINGSTNEYAKMCKKHK